MESRNSDFEAKIDTNYQGLLSEINEELPKGIDWTAGAQEYLERVIENMGRDGTMDYVYTKPFAPLDPQAKDRSYDVFLDLLNNFTSVLALLRLNPGSKILDVACGSGWLSHFLLKLGFEVVGIDLSNDFIEHAKKRVREDPHLPRAADALDRTFLVHDLEKTPLPFEHHFDAAIFESCLHHFYDPISALRHVAAALTDEGVAVIIEGENQKGPIKREYMDVMLQYATIERPYRREQLLRAFEAAGLPHSQFFCPVNGWFAPDAPATAALPAFVSEQANAMNRAICTKTSAALARLLPWKAALDKEIAYGQGFTEASEGGFRWSAPFSVCRIKQPLAGLSFELGSPIPDRYDVEQRVRAYTSDGRERSATLLKGSGNVVMAFENLPQDSELCFVSDRMFSPKWTGDMDPRLLSFFIKRPT